MKKVAIVGVGLIGGSLGMALKDKSKCKNQKEKYWIIGVGRHIEKLKLAKKLGAIDEYTADFIEGVKNADIVVLCTPVDKIVPLAKMLLPALKPGTVITDAGSVKSSITDGIKKILKPSGGITFLGAHPMAGSEKNGIRHADKNLFVDATVVLTPAKGTPGTTLREVRSMWLKTGANIMSMQPDRHDRLVGITSHLPHMLSASLVSVIAKAYKTDKNTGRLLAGSFRDMTRITDSDPALWAGISASNCGEIIKSIKLFRDSLEIIEALLKKARSGRGSAEELCRFFDRARNERKKLISR